MAATKKGTPKAKATADTKATAGKATTKSASPKAKLAAAAKTNPGAAGNGAAKKKAAAPRLSDKQKELLKKILDAGEAGYEAATKVEGRSIESLVEKKLVKKGTKNKETKVQRYLLTKVGQKHLPVSAPPAATPPTPPTA
jgi:hypothetical protein